MRWRRKRAARRWSRRGFGRPDARHVRSRQQKRLGQGREWQDRYRLRSSAPAWVGSRPPRRCGGSASTSPSTNRPTQFARIGAGIQIGCNAMKVLRGLGLEARLRAQSFYPRSWNNRDWRTGEVKFDMIFGESAEQKFGAPYLLAHRGDLHAALASAVPDECVRLNHKLVGLEETGEGVRLAFANGASCDSRRRGRRRRHPFPRERHSVRHLAGQLHPGGSPTAPPIPPRCSAAKRSTIAPNGGARTATSSSITSSRTAARSTSSPASRSRISGSSPGRRRATSGNCARRSPASTARSSRCWPHALMCINGRSSIAIRWSDGRIAT